MRDKRDAQQLVLRGEAHQKRGAFYEAVRAYKMAIEADADYAPAYAAWGHALAERLRVRDAVGKFTAALQRDPAVEVWSQLARSLHGLSSRASELERMWRTLKQVPAVDAWEKWGAVLLTLEEWAAAEEVYRHALTKAPTAANHRCLGSALGPRGKTVEALAELQQAMELSPKLPETYANLRALLTVHWPKDGALDRDSAVAQINEAVERIGAEVTYESWAVVLSQLGHHDMVVEMLQACADRGMAGATVYLCWACSLQALNRSDAAIEKLELFLEHVAGGGDVSSLWGGTLVLSNLSKESRVRLARFAAKLDNAGVYRELARLFWDSDYNVEAIEAFEALGRKDPTNAEPYVLEAYILRQLGRYDEAVAKSLVALERDPAVYEFLLSLDSGGVLADALARTPQDEKGHPKASLLKEVQAVVDRIHRANTYALWAGTLTNLGYHLDALAQFDAASRLGAADADFYLRWGQALAGRGLAENALTNCAEAIRVAPKHHALKALASPVLASLSGRMQGEQIVRLQQAVDATGDADAALVWGDILAELKRYDAAIAQYEKVTKLRPDFAAHRGWGRSLAAQERAERALEQHLLTIQESPDKVLTDLPDILHALRRVGDEAAAVQKTQELVDRLGRPWLYHAWGRVLGSLERPTEAETQFRRALTAGDKNVWVQIHLGGALRQLERYDEAIAQYQQALAAQPNDEVTSTLNWNWALALMSKGQAQESLAYYRQVTTSPWVCFNWANALEQVGDYEEAVKKYKEAVDAAGSDHIARAYSKHNIAVIRRRQGNYKAAAGAWDEALKEYEAGGEQAKQQDNADFFMYCGWTYENRRALTKAEASYRAGLELNPKHTGLLGSLAKLDRRLARRPFSEPGLNQPPTVEAPGKVHWAAWDFYQKARRLLSERVEREKTMASAVELGALHLAMEVWNDAEKALRPALSSEHPLIGSVHEGLAIVDVRSGQYRDAIAGFRRALERDRSNFDLWSNLAEAYLQANDLERSEVEYKALLQVAPGHVDARIGLGHVYVAMGDAAQQAGRKPESDDMFARAIEQFTWALEPTDSAVMSRQLDPPDRSPAVYARAYARVKIFEGQPTVKQEPELLKAALKDFQQVQVDHENYHKAHRAIRKLEERLEPPLQLAEKWGPRLVLGAVLFVFLAAQIAFFWGFEVRRDMLRLSSADIETMKSEGLPEDVAKKVRELASEQFSDREAMSARLRKVLGDAGTKFEPLVLRHALSVPVSDRLVAAGSYLTLTFGTLIFMIAALYLQQISKLKFGAIELEKSSGDLIRSSPSLGIGK